MPSEELLIVPAPFASGQTVTGEIKEIVSAEGLKNLVAVRLDFFNAVDGPNSSHGFATEPSMVKDFGSGDRVTLVTGNPVACFGNVATYGHDDISALSSSAAISITTIDKLEKHAPDNKTVINTLGLNVF